MRSWVELNHENEMIPNRIPLEELMEMLAAYGRPSLHQYVGSATPGMKAAGTWGCEVVIQTCTYEETGRADWYFVCGGRGPEGWSHTGRRCMGRADTPAEAAAQCLDECMKTMESPAGPYYRPVSTEAVKAQEARRQAES